MTQNESEWGRCFLNLVFIYKAMVITSFRRQFMEVQASDVFLSNIRNNAAMNGVDFEIYVQRSGTNIVLGQQALLEAVEVCVKV